MGGARGGRRGLGEAVGQRGGQLLRRYESFLRPHRLPSYSYGLANVEGFLWFSF